MADLRVALLGVSHWHVPLYLGGIPSHSFVGVCDENGVIAQRFADRCHCPCYTDYEQMIRETKPDFIFAFAPHYQMKRVAETLIDAGIGFSIEKPAGMNTTEVEDLYNRAEQKRAFCAIPFVWRYSDTVKDLKEKFLTSDIVHMSYKFVAGPPSRYLATSKWMLSRKFAGGGCMTNLGVHFIDMALYLTDSRDAEVCSSIYQCASPYDIETYASSMLRLTNGASLLLETGYAFPMSEGLQRENRWTIVTKDSYDVLAENHLELRTFDREPQNISINTDSDVYYPVFAETTLKDFQTGTKPRASLEEMMTVRNILDRMNESAKESRS